jgi:hypothetical protein
MPKEYDIVFDKATKEGVAALKALVKEKLEAGWEPLDGMRPCVPMGGYPADLYLYQTLYHDGLPPTPHTYDYDILFAQKREDLIVAVTTHINDGWELIGGMRPCLPLGGYPSTLLMYQTVCKREPPAP